MSLRRHTLKLSLLTQHLLIRPEGPEKAIRGGVNRSQ
jgi:hypothetical protein